MRLAVLIANSAIAIFFVAVFASTFFGRQQIERLARDFVTAKTIIFAAPVVKLAEDESLLPSGQAGTESETGSARVVVAGQL